MKARTYRGFYLSRKILQPWASEEKPNNINIRQAEIIRFATTSCWIIHRTPDTELDRNDILRATFFSRKHPGGGLESGILPTSKQPWEASDFTIESQVVLSYVFLPVSMLISPSSSGTKTCTRSCEGYTTEASFSPTDYWSDQNR